MDGKGRLKISAVLKHQMGPHQEWFISEYRGTIVIKKEPGGEPAQLDNDARILIPAALRPMLTGKNLIGQWRGDHLSILDRDLLIIPNTTP